MLEEVGDVDVVEGRTPVGELEDVPDLEPHLREHQACVLDVPRVQVDPRVVEVLRQAVRRPEAIVVGRSAGHFQDGSASPPERPERRSPHRGERVQVALARRPSGGQVEVPPNRVLELSEHRTTEAARPQRVRQEVAHKDLLHADPRILQPLNEVHAKLVLRL